MTKSCSCNSSPTLHYICNITVDLQDLWSRFHTQSVYNAGRQKRDSCCPEKKDALRVHTKTLWRSFILFCFLHFRWETNTKHNWLSYKLKHCTVQNILWIVLVKNIYIYNADLFLKYTQRHRHTHRPVDLSQWKYYSSGGLKQCSKSAVIVIWNQPLLLHPGLLKLWELVGSVQIWLDVDWHRSDWTEAHFSSDQRFSSLTPLLILQPICFFSALKTQDETRLRIERHNVFKTASSATTKPTRFVNWMTYFLLFLLVKFVGGFW